MYEKTADTLDYIIEGVMHSVDKWLEGEELNQDEVNRAATMREKTLRIVENAKTEVARDIEEFEKKIDRIYNRYVFEDTDYIEDDVVIEAVMNALTDVINDFDELKRKYTESGERE